MDWRAIEFFSGIGGLHYALEDSNPSATVVASFDINETANKVYKHNFGMEPKRNGIDKLKPDTIEKLKANIWLMSPPCQPYTAGGKRLDDKDVRANGLLNLIKILEELKEKPKLIFVENVPNFEISNSRDYLVKCLNQLKYHIDEFLISPVHFGIPNDRKRYYMAAYLSSETPLEAYPLDQSRIHFHPSSYIQDYPEIVPLKKLTEFLETIEEPIPEEYLVKPGDIRKRTNFIFDVVQANSPKTSTFTKAYGSHHFFGSGSFLQTSDLENPYKDDPEQLIASKPRFFTPIEVARLHYFPLKGESSSKHTLEFPESVTVRQRWMLLGNSLNVKVVAELLKELFRRS